MAWGYTRHKFGVCGNFKFEFISLTDVKATRSLIKPTLPTKCAFVATTNLTDNADILAGKTLAWDGTADSNTPNELIDSSEVFDARLYDVFVANTDATAFTTARVQLKSGETTKLNLYKPDRSAVYDAFPSGNETYTIYDERVIQVIAASANDDGTLLVMG